MGKNYKKPSSFRKNPRVQFDRRGSFKKGKRPNTNFEKSGEDFDADKTVYRILCPIKKIGSVIGKGGDIIKRLRDETHAKIKVAESVPGTDERVVIVFSSSTKSTKAADNNENQENPEEDTAKDEHDPLEPHCPAQHALLKVHERIAEDDGLFGGPEREERNEDDLVTARILVPSNQVGCLIGKGGHVIQKLRTETGANIRILPKDHIPACAMRTDELVQISGTSAVANKALYEVSTLLYQNPRPPMDDPIPDDRQGFYPPGPMGDMPPRGNPMSQWHSGFRGPPPMPWENEFPRFPHGDASAEFSMKILCPTERIGVVIGKGGGKVKHLQRETGTKIHVEETTPDAAERAILISSFDAPWNPISPTIEAILHLQVEISAISEDGTITTRLLVPSSKVGCLLGQGGHIINEMRRRSRADIRIISKEGKPSYASVDEELVQVSGNVNVARDALTEISSRLRMRSLESISGAAEAGPVGPFHGFGHPESFPERRGPPLSMTGGRTSGGYQHIKGGGYDFEPQRYPPQPTSRFPNINSSMQVKIPNSAINSVLGVGGSNISNIGQVSGAKVKLNDAQGGGSECVVEIHGSLEQMDVAQNLLQNYISSSMHQHSSAAEHKYNSHPQPKQQHPYSSIPNNQSPYAAAAAPNSNSQQLHQNTTYASSAAAAPNSKSQHYQNSYASAAPSSNTQQYQNSYGSANATAAAAAPSSNTQQYQSSYGSTAAAAPSSNTQYQQQNSYAGAAAAAGAAPTSNTAQQYQSSYGSTAAVPSANTQSSYAAAVPSANNQSPYAAAPSSNTQQHQNPYYASSGVQNYTSQPQQQQSPYAATVPTYSAYHHHQQQQQQSTYGSAAQNYSVQQQQQQQQPEQQGSYASATQGYEGQQQQGSYQY